MRSGVLILISLVVVFVSCDRGLELEPSPKTLKCTSCKLAAFAFETALKNNSSETNIFSILEKACVLFNFYPAPVCNGIAKSMGPELTNIFNTYKIPPVNLCYRLSLCDDPDDPQMPMRLPPRPVATAPRRALRKMSFLQLTDVHFDPHYEIGQDTTCEYPICCRNSTNSPGGGGHKSRRWGEYTCDPPLDLLDAMFAQAAHQFPDLDGIIWNGDNRCADIWMYTRPNVLEVTTRVTDLLKKYFPKVPVLPTIGNHDNSPIDQFWMPEYAGLLQSFLGLWSDWIPADQHETFQQTGYWTGELQPGFRVVSLHTTWADLYNFYGLINVTDPGGQLAWLVDVLSQAEKDSERVVIIGHIPMIVTGELERHYAQKYAQIVLRFKETIVGSHWGHTHKAHYALTQTAGVANLVQLMSGSVTPREGRNPQMRLIQYENATLSNFQQYIVRLNNSYTTPDSTPVLEFLYDPISAYGMVDLSPQSFQKLAERMFTDDDLYDLYMTHEFGDSPIDVRPKPKPDQRVANICNMLHSTAAPYKQCLAEHK